MKRDALCELLAKADEASPPPAISGDLPARVRARRRRQDRRRGVAALGLLIAATAGALLWRPGGPRSPVANENDLRNARAELAQLDKEAKRYEKRADQLKQIESALPRLSAADYAMLQSDPLQPLHEARQRAALILVRDGDRLRADPQERQQAAELYRRACSLFPDTPAGQQAQSRLNLHGA